MMRGMRRTNPRSRRWRRGFTLVEMLIVVGIFLALAVVTTPIALRLNQGRALRDAVRLTQATLIGARDRAAVTKRPVGVRFLVDEDTPNVVRAMQLVQQVNPNPKMQGTVHLVRPLPPVGATPPGPNPLPLARLPGLHFQPPANFNPALNAIPPAHVLPPFDQTTVTSATQPACLVVGARDIANAKAFPDFSSFANRVGEIRFNGAGPWYRFTPLTSQDIWLINGDFSLNSAPPSPAVFKPIFVRMPLMPVFNSAATIGISNEVNFIPGEPPDGTAANGLRNTVGIPYEVRRSPPVPWSTSSPQGPDPSMDIEPVAGADPVTLPASVVIEMGLVPAFPDAAGLPRDVNIGGSLPTLPVTSPPGTFVFPTIAQLASKLNGQIETVESPDSREPAPAPANGLVRIRYRWVFYVMFSPSGQVLPPQADQSFVTLWLREDDAPLGQTNETLPRPAVRARDDQSKHAVVCITTATGLVRSIRPTLTPMGSADPRNDAAGPLTDPDLYLTELEKNDSRGL